jgi:alpha-D-ribose 1-methylphosphonate 5-triphosphate synthase subunit PhnG
MLNSESIENSSFVMRNSRKEWLELLSASDPVELRSLMSAIARPNFTWLRKPQMGLYMVRGQIGGNGGAFNLGEVPVTRCVLRVLSNTTNPTIGVGYTLGRAPDHATLCAIADALLQDSASARRLQDEVLAPLTRTRESLNRQRYADSQATRVEFFSVARESPLGESL